MFHEEKKTPADFWGAVTPRVSFLLGLILAIFLTCTIGFFVILSFIF